MCDHLPDPPNIGVSRQRRDHAGSCNSCQQRKADTVICVRLKTLTFRVCDECATKLVNDLQRTLIPSMR